MSAQLTIAPGSIKAKILEAVVELGPGATGAAIRRRHPSNEHLVNVSIEQLTQAGLIEITSEGNYRLAKDTQKAMGRQSVESAVAAISQQRKVTFEQLAGEPKPVPPARPVRPIPRAAPAPAAPSPAVGPQNSATEDQIVAKIECNKCSASKAKDDFYHCKGKLVQPCKQCTLQRQKALRDGTAKPAKRAANTAVARRLLAPSRSGELVIPAGGEITCRSDGHSYEFRQFDALITCTSEQLKAVRDWASAQLKARS